MKISYDLLISPRHLQTTEISGFNYQHVLNQMRASHPDKAFQFRYPLEEREQLKLLKAMFRKELGYHPAKFQQDQRVQRLTTSYGTKTLHAFEVEILHLAKIYPKELKYFISIFAKMRGQFKDFYATRATNIVSKRIDDFNYLFSVATNRGKHKIRLEIDKRFDSYTISRFVARVQQFLVLFPGEELVNLNRIYLHYNEPYVTKEIAYARAAVFPKNNVSIGYQNAGKSFLNSDSFMAFFHEMGHALALKEFGNTVPRGWDEVVQRDNRSVSAYGDTHLREDFAESVLMYLGIRIFHNQENLGFDPLAYKTISGGDWFTKVEQLRFLEAKDNPDPTAPFAPSGMSYRAAYYHHFRFLDNIFNKSPAKRAFARKFVIAYQFRWQLFLAANGATAIAVGAFYDWDDN